MRTLLVATRLLVRVTAGVVFMLWTASAAAQTVAILTDATPDGPVRYGLTKIEEALRAKGFSVQQGRDAVKASAFVVLAGIRSANGAATAALTAANAPLPQGAEALTIRRNGQYEGKRAVVLVGSDSVGLMYAALDVAERIGWSQNRTDPFDRVRDATEKPTTGTRGVSIFTMNRAYFESRFYDERFWMRYFDMLAADRFNNFALIAGYENGGFLAPIYPYFFDVDGYPDVKMLGMTREMQAKNVATFKNVMRLAHERGITVTLGIWDHIGSRQEEVAAAGAAAADRGRGAGGRGGGFGGPPPGPLGGGTGNRAIPGVIPAVSGVISENLVPYSKAAIAKLYQVFPELDAIQFRMHNESGLRPEEMPNFWHEVFTIIRGAGKRVDLRAKGLDKSIIADAVKQGVKPTVNTKVWMEQAGLPFHPTHINTQNQQDARAGYADLLEYPQTYEMTWQLWTSGTNRLLLWGDPDYVRRFTGAAQIYGRGNIEINELGATKMHGATHDAEPIPVLTAPYRTYDYEFERYWHYYRTWGRLTYNPRTAPEVWEQEFVRRFGGQAGPHVMRALHLASQVLPRVVAASYLYSNFPTTGAAGPEMGAQGSLPLYAAREEGSDIQQFMNVRDAAKSIIDGTDTPMRRPEETSRWFANVSDGILRELADAQKTASPSSKEFLATAADLKILAGLARYHSARLLGGVAYNLYQLSGDLGAFDEAIAHERRAVQDWSDMVAGAGDVYGTNLVFGPRGRPFPYHWNEVLGWLNDAFNQLLEERKTATARPDAKPARIPARDPNAKPPVVTLPPVAPAPLGSPVVVTANVTAPAGVKWVRLRYRHVNQKEDYETAEMTLDQRTGLYSGAIPAPFVDSIWNLMYFVEVVDRNGFGRMYPDLEVETPYVIVPVKRQPS